jgi:hypothetical protein
LQKNSSRRHKGFDVASNGDAQYLEQGVGEMKDLVKAAAMTNYRPIGEILMLKTVTFLLCIPVLGFQRIL